MMPTFSVRFWYEIIVVDYTYNLIINPYNILTYITVIKRSEKQSVPHVLQNGFVSKQ